MSDVVLRPYRHPEDHAALLDIWREAGLPHDPEGRDSAGDIARQVAGEGAVYLVAEADGGLVGVLLASHDGRKGWLNRAAVRPEWQRRGVISALVGEAERRFQQRGIRVFACLVEDGNEASKAGCRRLGYEPTGVTYFRKKSGASDERPV